MPAPEANPVDGLRSADKALLLETIQAAGMLAKRYFETGAKSWVKDKGEPVTEADIAVDATVREALARARPDDGLLSEETADSATRLEKPRVWLVDPIDGTRAFIKGKPHFAVSIALVEDGRPVLGAVFNPVLDELFAAEEGRGATLNGTPLAVSGHATVEGCRMLGARDMFEHPAWPERWPTMTIENRDSIAYRMALVASGAFDGALALSKKREWDLAAADLLVREAGGLVTTHLGDTLTYNGATPLHPSMVCAGPLLHAQLLARVNWIKNLP